MGWAAPSTTAGTLTAALRARPHVALCLALGVATLFVYWPATGHEFVNFDDDRYVTANYDVQKGLTADSLRWCTTAMVAGNWHPVTLVSHMLDVRLHGLEPGGHHRTSVLLHAANTLLLFLVLAQMTAAPWRSAVIAALFALHPLHVESVAWVAERKDVLSTLFWILTLGAYARYAARPGIGRYLPVFALLALGLMAKPMLVTLPFVLLLLDYWPLRRMGPGTPAGTWRRLLLEKLPLLALAAASSVVTYVVQQSAGAVRSEAAFPLGVRAANALVAYVAYLGKTLWPADLAVLYPHPRAVPGWQVAGAFLLLAAVTALALRTARRRPYLVVGWLWYLGTLVPVIGLVQVGIQSMADRYTYVPHIGLFVAVVWSLGELAARSRRSRAAFAVAGVLLLGLLAAGTRAQLRHWNNSITLFEQALRVTTDNYTAHNNLGLALLDAGRTEDAIHHYAEAVRIHPGFAKAHNNLGSALRKQGRVDEALRHFEQALRIDPHNARTHNNLANCLTTLGRTEEAIAHYAEAVRLRPDYALAHYNLAVSLRKLGRTDEAILHYTEALRVNPRLARAHNNLGVLLRDEGRLDEAIRHLSEALRLDPDYDRARRNLAKAEALRRGATP